MMCLCDCDQPHSPSAFDLQRSGTSQKKRVKHTRVRRAPSAWVPPCFSLLGAGAYAYIALVRSVLSSKQ
eukprot:scaffold12517_cov22-Tisochrysis_lutea.AAC.3